MRPRHVSSLALLATLALAAPALGQGTPSTLAPADEIRALQVEIDRDAAMLATGSCAVACQALASMRRAAERVCALDPGQRCADARGKVRDAARRVQETCGDCGPLFGQSSTPAVEPDKPASAKEKGLEQQQAPQAASPPPPPAPQPKQANQDEVQVEAVRAPPRGGCAGCFVGGDDAGPAGAALLAAVAAFAASARRRRRRGFSRR